MFPERGWRPDQGVGALDPKLGREPRPARNPGLGPGRRREIMLGREVLGQGRKQGVPPLVTEGRRLIPQQTRLRIAGLRPDRDYSASMSPSNPSAIMRLFVQLLCV